MAAEGKSAPGDLCRALLADAEASSTSRFGVLFARGAVAGVHVKVTASVVRDEAGSAQGRMLILHDDAIASAERMSLFEMVSIQNQLDCAPITIVRLGRDGVSTHANESWRRFARENGANGDTIEVSGSTTSQRCAAPTTRRSRRGPSAFAGSSPASAGRSRASTRVTARTSRAGSSSLRRPAVTPVVVIHTNVTDHYLTERRLHVQRVVAQGIAEAAPVRTTLIQMISAACDGGNWDFGAIWESAPDSVLRCSHATEVAQAGLASFTDATRDVTFGVGVGRSAERGRPAPRSGF